MTLFYLNFTASLLLIIVGFIVPPTGEIDGSVLTAVGMLLMFTVVEQIPEAIRASKSIRVTKGDFTAQVDARTDAPSDKPPDDHPGHPLSVAPPDDG